MNTVLTTLLCSFGIGFVAGVPGGACGCGLGGTLGLDESSRLSFGIHGIGLGGGRLYDFGFGRTGE
jgi:hypothetical protein